MAGLRKEFKAHHPMRFRRQRGFLRPWFAGLIFVGAGIAALIFAPEEVAKVLPERGDLERLAILPSEEEDQAVTTGQPEKVAKAASDAWNSITKTLSTRDHDNASVGAFAESAPLAAQEEPAREIYGIGFGPALNAQEAAKRWNRLRATHKALADLEPRLYEDRLWAVWPVYELVVTGPDAGALDRLCDTLVLEGTSCEPKTVPAERLSPLTAIPALEQQGTLETQGGGHLRKAEAASEAEEEPGGREQAAFQAGTPPHVYRLATPDPADPRTARIIAVGDVMMGSDFPSRYGLHPRLRKESASVEAVLPPAVIDLIRQGDLAFFNLEGVLLDGGEAAKACEKCFAFRSPEFYADLLAEAGFTTASLANNHSGDFGDLGREATVRALTAAGIASAGLPKEDARTASQTLPNGLRVATVAFAPNRGTLSMHDVDAAEALVADLDTAHDIVIVSVHAGGEGPRASRVTKRTETYLGEDRGNVHDFSNRMMAAGADLVVGHGPHVPRAMELVDGKLIAYSLGNFWTYTGFISWGLLGVGPVLDVTLTADGEVKKLTVHSTRQAGKGVPRLDSIHEARRFMLDRTRRDFPETYELLRKSRRPVVAELTVPGDGYIANPNDPQTALLGVTWPSREAF